MFKKPFSFEGRIRRTEYGLGILFSLGGIFVSSFIIDILGVFFNKALKDIVLTLVLIPVIVIVVWFYLAQAVKRSHDIGNSGWYILIPFYRLYLFFADSQFGPNKYGTNPKNLGNENEIDTIGQIVD